MTLSVGARLGPYEILAAIGAGGMGEVWKARDTRLDRLVAIKTVTGAFSERFEREARAISALNHPHICTLFDVGEHEGAGYLVMEYVEGAPLQGPLPLDQALKHAIQICDALDAAHRKGIVHRDLKPPNILVTKTGIKLLDFGLAKAIGPADTGRDRSDRVRDQDPGSVRLQVDREVTKALTGAHVILGTPQYMAPEQIDGRDADARADLFAFGCVLYELVTGQKAFDGKTPSSVMAAILATEPRPLRELQPVTPPALERVVRRCLAKDPDDRWQTARDLKAELTFIADGGTTEPVRESAARKRTRLVPWTVAAICAVSTAALAIVLWTRQPAETLPARFTVAPPQGVVVSSAISPDGRRIALTVAGGGPNRLWIRSLDALALQAVPGTGEANAPFWSPDGRYVAFFVPGKLLKIDVTGGGPPQTICATQFGTQIGVGGTWNPDGVILFNTSEIGAVWRVGAAGGTPVQQTHPPGTHRYPYFLPDGATFLLSVARAPGEVGLGVEPGLYYGTLDSRDIHKLTDTTSRAIYVPGSRGKSGHLLFDRDTTLMAQPFDAARRQIMGEASRVADIGNATGPASYSASQNGVLIYQERQSTPTRIAWFDRQGRRLDTIGEGDYNEFGLSPDDGRVVAQGGAADLASRPVGDLWLVDPKRQGSIRFTFGAAFNRNPVWSPDGSRVAFNSNRDPAGIYTKAASGSGDEELLLKSPAIASVTDWSADGNTIVYHVRDATTKDDIWVLPLTGDRQPVPFLQTGFIERQGQLSRDGRWMAYTSDQTGGRLEVYVRPYPKGPGLFQISTAGGVLPKWRRDGKELFFVTPDGRLMAVEIHSVSPFQYGAPRPLFVVDNYVASANFVYRYAPSADGTRFLMSVRGDATAPNPIIVVTNWRAALGQ